MVFMGNADTRIQITGAVCLLRLGTNRSQPPCVMLVPWVVPVVTIASIACVVGWEGVLLHVPPSLP